MKARNCCKTMEMELTTWKGAIYDILRKLEKLPNTEKAVVFPNIEDIHILVEDLDTRIEEIRESCTPETGINDIKTEREQVQASMGNIRMKVEDAMVQMSAGDFGG